jgi:hypothetical protein
MNRVLKYAWYQLIVIITATFVMAVTLGLAAVYWRGKEFSAFIPLGLFALVHFYSVFFPLKAGEIGFDERDEKIKDRATRISFTILWYVFILACLIPLLSMSNRTIPVMYLGWMIFCAGVTLRIVWSIAVIAQYGKGNKVIEGGAA